MKIKWFHHRTFKFKDYELGIYKHKLAGRWILCINCKIAVILLFYLYNDTLSYMCLNKKRCCKKFLVRTYVIIMRHFLEDFSNCRIPKIFKFIYHQFNQQFNHFNSSLTSILSFVVDSLIMNNKNFTKIYYCFKIKVAKRENFRNATSPDFYTYI